MVWGFISDDLYAGNHHVTRWVQKPHYTHTHTHLCLSVSDLLRSLSPARSCVFES